MEEAFHTRESVLISSIYVLPFSNLQQKHHFESFTTAWHMPSLVQTPQLRTYKTQCYHRLYTLLTTTNRSARHSYTGLHYVASSPGFGIYDLSFLAGSKVIRKKYYTYMHVLECIQGEQRDEARIAHSVLGPHDLICCVSHGSVLVDASFLLTSWLSRTSNCASKEDTYIMYVNVRLNVHYTLLRNCCTSM